MEQVLFAGYGDALNSGATEYNGLPGGHSWLATEFDRSHLVSTSGKLKNLRVELAAAPGVGTSYTFTLRVNGVNSALTVTIADAITSAEDITHKVDVVAGDAVCLQCVPAGTPTTPKARWTTMFEGNTAKESLVLGGSRAMNSDTYYAPVSQSICVCCSVENDTRRVCPTSGKFKNLYVRLAEDPGTSPDAYRFTLRVNGVSSTLTCTITADDTTGNNTINEVTVSAGDVLTLMIEPLNAPTNSPNVIFGMTFVADTDGESLILGGTNHNLSYTTTKYSQVITAHYSVTWSSTESDRHQLGQACTLKKLYVLLQAAPGDGHSYTFTVRETSVDTAITVTISGVATTGNDTVNTHSVAGGDEVDLECIPAGEYPASADAYWGLVGYIAVAGYYHGLKVQGVGELALCDVASNPLRIRKGGITYGIELVETDDPNASAIRIKTPAGIKSIRKYT